MSFPLYAESIGFDASKGSYDIEASKSESIRMLSAAAKEAGVWLVGGESVRTRSHRVGGANQAQDPSLSARTTTRSTTRLRPSPPTARSRLCTGRSTCLISMFLEGSGSGRAILLREETRSRLSRRVSRVAMELAAREELTLRRVHLADFGKIGVGICYDVRFPELAMIAARRGPFQCHRGSARSLTRSSGCIAMVYPGAFNTTTGPLHWDLLQRAR